MVGENHDSNGSLGAAELSDWKLGKLDLKLRNSRKPDFVTGRRDRRAWAADLGRTGRVQSVRIINRGILGYRARCRCWCSQECKVACWLASAKVDERKRRQKIDDSQHL